MASSDGKSVAVPLAAIRTTILIIAFSVLSGGIGYWFGTHDVSVSWDGYRPRTQVVNTEAPTDKQVDFALFWEVWDQLEKKYIDQDKLDPEQMVYGAIKGMTASLGDQYTVFLPPVQNEKTREDLQGEFGGIGAELGLKDERISVVAPLKDTPAERAGILAGDIIVEVNGEDTFGWTVQGAVDKIRGPKGEAVTLTIYRDGLEEPLDIDIIRDVIQVPTVETEYRDNVAVISLYQFGQQTNDQWDEIVSEVLTKCTSDCKGIVLDLRNNPGGYLDGAVFIASEFLSEGVVVKEEHSSGRKQELRVNRQGKLLSQPLVVLLNGGSASASEIVAGALDVHGRATIVGQQSYGKGTIQERIELPQNAGIHITTAKWLLPDDSWIHKVGITPDIEVAYDRENPEVDEQLERAIEELNNPSL